MRKSRLYPRHFSLAIPTTVHTIQPEIEAEAKGHLEVRVRLAVQVTASQDHLPDLIRVAGWAQSAVTKATAELEPAPRLGLFSIKHVFTPRQVGR